MLIERKTIFRKTREFVIYSQRFDGTGRKRLLTTPDATIALAYDWISNYIYRSETNVIYVTDLKNTSLVRTLDINMDAM